MQFKSQNCSITNIEFSISTLFSSIRPIDRTLSWVTTPGQSGPGFLNRPLCIPQSFSVTVASPSDHLVSYIRHSFGEFYPSTEMQSVYSTAPDDWALFFFFLNLFTFHYLLFALHPRLLTMFKFLFGCCCFFFVGGVFFFFFT